uniref:LAGLIDADG endonuclease domain-containing protein n=1 Tax=Schizosaccharomyces osmophilus TaxID=2545709 RepID=UPI00237AD3FE|nr:LAGLIDADG endonuclease domain-containing protein [Schizosaccharomyces osmophilus]WCA44842.1 LAGLIDADG endonuclease domain-containing protein [Schizosaccharomyces osmophilus]
MSQDKLSWFFVYFIFLQLINHNYLWNTKSFIKHCSMRETPLSEVNTLNQRNNSSFLDVKKSLTWGQSAWYYNFTKLMMPSETTRSAFNPSGSNNQSLENINNLNNKHNIKKIPKQMNFEQWLIGIVDGNGSFSFSKEGTGYWRFTFKVGQSNYNLRLLYYIKSILGIGKVNILQTDKNEAEYRLRRNDLIIQYILPIFDNNPLLTSKYFNYMQFRQAILIMNDSSLTSVKKDNLISQIKNKTLPINFISPIWGIINYKINSKKEVQQVMSKSWLVGYTEAEGSFNIVQKGGERLVHAFEITQKLDLIVLEAISLILPLNVKDKKTYFTVVTTKKANILFIIDFFKNTMKGMKSLEYRIWSKSFSKTKQDYFSLLKARNLMRKIRIINLLPNLKIQKSK